MPVCISRAIGYMLALSFVYSNVYMFLLQIKRNYPLLMGFSVFFLFFFSFCRSYNFGCRYLLLLSAYWYDNVDQGITVSYLFSTSSDSACFFWRSLIMRNLQLRSSCVLIYILILQKKGKTCKCCLNIVAIQILCSSTNSFIRSN